MNPLCAGLVSDIQELDKYPFSVQSAIMGRQERDWQDTGYVLKLFADKKATARRRYKSHLAKGIAMGERPDLTGGGLVRSSGGWAAIKAIRKDNVHLKSDERIVIDEGYRLTES